MALDELIAVINRLRERMEDHRIALSQNEMMTRYVLIDPLLVALGWDTSDPSQVRLEYETGTKWADYALLKADGTTPSVFVEAKSLSKALSKGLDQGITYCVKTSTSYFVVTNGREWALYDAFLKVDTEDPEKKKLGGFDISGPASKAALNAVSLLWKPLLRDEVKPSSAGGRVNPTPGPSPAEAPLAQAGRGAREPHPQPLPASREGRQDQRQKERAEAESTARNWPDSVVPLDTFEAKAKAPPPKRLFLPDDQQRNLHRWKDLLVEIANYLADTKRLSSRDCPVKLPRAYTRYLVHTKAVHPSGKSFFAPRKLDDHGLHLETNASPPVLHEQALFLIDHCGEEPSRYGVESG